MVGGPLCLLAMTFTGVVPFSVETGSDMCLPTSGPLGALFRPLRRWHGVVTMLQARPATTERQRERDERMCIPMHASALHAYPIVYFFF